MSEALLYIDSDEEITAILDRVREHDAGELRLVVPKGALILQSLISLKILKREVDQLGKILAIVTQDPVGLRLGEQANISVFAKPKDDAPVFRARETAAPTVRKTAVSTEADSEDAPLVTDAELDEPVASEPVVPEETPDGISVHRYDRGEAIEPVGASATSRLIPAQTLLKRAKQRETTVPKSVGRFVRLILALGLIGAISWVAFLFLAPRASVLLTLATEPLEQTVSLVAVTEATAVDIDNARIPAQSLQAEVSLELSAPATGKKQVGEKATATVNLYNYWDANPQVVSEGTLFKASDGTTFVATAAATIPGAATTLKEGKVVTTPGKASTTIKAEQAGPDANGKSGTLTIPSLPQVRQDKIYGEPIAPTAGGTSKEVTVVTQGDREALKNTTKDALNAQALADLTTQAAGQRLLEGAIQLDLTTEQFSAEVGAEAETLTLNLSGLAKGLTFRDEDLKTIAIAVLEKSVPTARTIIFQETDTLAPTTKSLDIVNGNLEITAAFTTKTALAIDTNDLRADITGMRVTEAESTLRGTAGVADVVIKNRPSWLKTLPKRESQVEITVDYQSS